MFIAVFAAVLLAGAVLVGYVNYSKGQDEKADRAADLSQRNLVVCVELTMMKKDKASVEALRDAILNARRVVGLGAGSLQKRENLKMNADQAVGVKSVLEDGTPEQKKLAKLLDGL